LLIAPNSNAPDMVRGNERLARSPLTGVNTRAEVTQRNGVALARVMVPCPRLVLLDELFSSLYAGQRAET